MKKYRIIVSSIILLIVIIIRLFFKNVFLKIKKVFLLELSLLNLFYNLVGVNFLTKEVAKTNIIYCKNYVLYNEGYLVYTLNNTICLPFEGIVSKRTKNGSNILFTIEDVKPNLHLYEKINPDTIIAYASSYIIYANEKNNISYLNYKVSYEVI
mgnify:CR=1 FL=1